MIRRVVLLVLDGVGIGALPDAGLYGDLGADTLGNLSRRVGGLALPTLQSLGLGAVARIEGVGPHATSGAAGRMAEVSIGKDSTVGHWEIAGVVNRTAFATFPDGFPRQVVESLERRIGRKVFGNCPASGTVIIEELGERHLATGHLILYTSADSVLQLAAHENVVPRETLYAYCREARKMLDEEGPAVLRVIARPFSGRPGAFTRSGRLDFSLPPPEETVLDALRGSGFPVLGIGKVGDIYGGRGLDSVWKTAGNREGFERILRALGEWPRGVVVANLIDFDTLYGHRNDCRGFAGALEEFDAVLGGRILPALGGKDLLIITADHGCDPTLASTDHHREYVPLLAWRPAMGGPVDLGTRKSFCDVAATVMEGLTGRRWARGRSFWEALAGRPGAATPARTDSVHRGSSSRETS